MTAQIHKLPGAALTEDELLDQILAEVPAPMPGLIATREQRRERYARLARDCEARRARAGFRVIAHD